MKRWGGYTLVELAVTLALGAVVAASLGTLLLTHLRAARIVAARVSAANAIRTAVHVLAAEVRLARAGADLHGFAADSIALRLPRLSGTVCARTASHIWIRTAGMRAPDQAKDSLLLIGGAGEVAAPLSGLAQDAAACEPRAGLTTYRLAAPADSGAGAVALIFETGTYYVRDRALRYRIGAEGRQPLTEEWFLAQGSGFSLRPDSPWPSFTARLTPGPVFGRVIARPASTSFPLLNTAGAP